MSRHVAKSQEQARVPLLRPIAADRCRSRKIAADLRAQYRFSDKIVVVENHKLSTGRNNGQMEDFPKWILTELKKTGRIRKQQIVQRTGHSNSTVSRSLVKLREDGQIVFEGSPRNGYWRLV